MKKIRYLVDLILLGLIFLGITTHIKPMPPEAIFINSPAEKRQIKHTRVSQTIIDQFAQRLSVHPELTAAAARFLEKYKSKSPVEYIRLMNRMKDPNSSFWRNFARIARQETTITSHPRILGDDDEPDSSTTTDDDFTTETRVNSVTTNLQFQPDFAVGDDGIIYAVWGSDEAGSDSGYICFSKSTDGGATWAPRTIIDNVGPNRYPRIAVYGSGSSAHIYVAYTYIYDASNYDYDVYVAVSSDGGATWGYAALGASDYYENFADIAVDDAGYVYVIFNYIAWSTGSCDEGDLDYNIVYRYSSTGGSTWSGIIPLINSGSCQCALPAIDMYGGGGNAVMHMTYVYDYNCNSDDHDYDVRYRKYGNVGTGSPTLLLDDRWIAASTNDEYAIPDGIAVDDNGNPHIVFTVDAGNDSGSVYYRRSTDGGSTFLPTITISAGSWYEIDPVIDTDPMNNPVIAWRDHRHGDGDIYFTWSPDGGNTFVPAREVDKEVTAHDQYWPSVVVYSESDCRRHIHFGWWSTTYDDGDIYYNGNRQYAAVLEVSFPTGIPDSLPHFVYHDFDSLIDTVLSAPGTYGFWYDPEYASSYEPLLNFLLPGSGDSIRWACDTPGVGWQYLAPSYWWGQNACGVFDVAYYQQVRVRFAPAKGNPAECTHTMPSIDIRYQKFGAERDTFANSSYSVSDWVDRGSEYHFRGWVDISPHERWAITSAETVGTADFPGTVSPTYYHQWLPHIWFSGTDTDNFTWTTRRTILGYSSLDDSLVTDWMDWVDCGTHLAFSETTSLGYRAINTYDTLVTTWIPSYTIIYTPDKFVTIQTDFGAGQVLLDGVLYSSPHTELLAPGSDHTIGAPTPQTFDDTTQYHFTTWSDGSADTVRTITVPDHDVTYIAEYDRYFKINTGYTGSTGGHIPIITGEGWYAEGSWATITATPGFDSTTGIRYGFSHWESDPPGATFMDSTSPATQVLVDHYYRIIAVYSVQYSLEISSDYGTPEPPVGVNWFDAGATVVAVAGSPDTVAHKYCSGFLASGSGLPGSGTADSLTFTITEPTWITWLWSDQVWLYVICPYGSPSPPAGTTYYDPGTTVDAHADSIIMFSPDMRQLCTGYTGTDGIGSGGDNDVSFTITTNCTLQWNYQTQYTFEVINPGGHDSPVPPEGEQWYDDGSVITAYVTSPDGDYVCIGYYGTGSLPSVSPHDSVTFTLTSPTTIQWRWALSSEVVTLTVNSPGGAGDPFPSGTTYWVPGATVTAYVTSPWYDSYPDGVRDSCTGWTGTGSAPSSGSNDTVTFVINTNSTITWNWVHQYRFVVNNPLGYDTPNPPEGEHWYDAGSVVEGWVTSPWEDSIICTGYDGEGSLGDGDTNWFSFVIDTPSAVTWQWEVNNVNLTVISAHGSPIPAVGTHTYVAGTTVHCEVDSVVYGADGERWVCVGWTGTGSVPASGDSCSVDFVITEDSQIEWLWEHQYRLRVASDHGTPSPPVGDNWFSEGDTIDCTISPTHEDTFFCVGYSGTGSVPSGEYGVDSVRIVLTEPSTITWLWMGASSVAALDVSSEYGHPVPEVGIHYYPIGTIVAALVPDATQSLGDGHRRRCIGYEGTGSVGSGTDTIVVFTINENSTIEWLWAEQYRLTVINPGGYDSPNPPEGDHWFNAGSVVTASVTPEDDTMRCIGYYGTGSVPASGWGSSVTFVINLPSSVEWRWVGESGVCRLDVSSGHDSPDPPEGTNYIPCGQWILATVDLVDTISPGRGWFCTGWTGSGSVPPVGDTNFTSFRLDEYSTLNWQWEVRNLLVLTYEGETGGEVPTQTGGGWHPEDETVTVYTDPELYDGTTHYGFVEWECRGADIWVEHPEFYQTRVVVSAPCTLVAHYATAVACTLVKSPAQQWGGFIVDGVEYPNTDTVTFWWGRNSYHHIQATTPDINGDSTEAYAFSHWSDGGDNPHWVEASASFVLCAYYTHQHRVDITKDPPRDFGYLWVDSSFIFDDEYHDWWDEGSVHSIAVSTPDLSTRVRYYLSHWSDGDTAYMRDVGPVDSVVNLVAYYDGQVKIMVTKNPLENYGSITINDSTYDSVGTVYRWIDFGVPVEVSVSAVDVHEGTDTAYLFSHWNDDTTDTLRPKDLGTPTEGTNIVANYEVSSYNLEFSISPTTWDLDTLDREYTRTMYPFEVITLNNTGTIPIDFGLQTVEDLTSWTAGYSPGYNRYTLRAEFDQNSLPPVSFQPAYDYVKTSIQWADSRFFGPMGYYVAPGDWLHLWLQFITPTGTFDYSRQTIILQVRARPTIY